MSDVDYKRLLETKFQELGEMVKQREALELQIAKLQQFIRATANMLSDEDRAFFEAQVDMLAGDSMGLTEAIRNTLKTAEGKWLTAVAVRDRLLGIGFNFSGYTSNPLASVHAVLKRLKPDEVETTTIESVTAYRWKKRAKPKRAPGASSSFESGYISGFGDVRKNKD